MFHVPGFIDGPRQDAVGNLSATVTKNQFYFFFVFQNYVTEPVSDRSFKPSFKKDTCLF